MSTEIEKSKKINAVYKFKVPYGALIKGNRLKIRNGNVRFKGFTFKVFKNNDKNHEYPYYITIQASNITYESEVDTNLITYHISLFEYANKKNTIKVFWFEPTGEIHSDEMSMKDFYIQYAHGYPNLF